MTMPRKLLLKNDLYVLYEYTDTKVLALDVAMYEDEFHCMFKNDKGNLVVLYKNANIKNDHDQIESLKILIDLALLFHDENWFVKMTDKYNQINDKKMQKTLDKTGQLHYNKGNTKNDT